MNKTQACLSREILDQIGRDEILPNELQSIEDHVSECEHCRELFAAVTAEPDWTEEILPVLRERRGATPDVAEADQSCGQDSVLSLLGPTDDPRMLGRIGPYEVTGVIGRGGMGIVFKAFDAPLNRFVAIKMMLPHLATSAAARKRFSREGQAAAAVVDDHVLPIYGVNEWQGVPYLVTQYSSGMSLQKRIQDQAPLELKEILRIGMQAARGLAAAHAQGLVHRDVKPSNILLDGTVERALLTDFGLARAVDDASLTRSGTITGTPQFMAPEQARGESVDQRSDLFSLGAVIYAMCTGHPPFRAETSYGVLRRITDDEPRPIREINPDVPDWLCGIVAKLMAKQPANRFASASEVAELLEQFLAHLQQPATVPLPHAVIAATPAANRNRRPPMAKLIGAAAFAFALLFAGVLIVLELNKGKLTIQCDADAVPIRIMQGDELVQKLTVTKSGKTVRIAAGQYVVKVDGEIDGITVEDGAVSLKRGGRETVRVVKSVDQATPQPSSETEPNGFTALLSLCDVPFRHLPFPSTWSEARYNASLLADGQFQAAVKMAPEQQAQIAGLYLGAEAEALTPDAEQPSWEKLLDRLHELMTSEQIARAHQLRLQQMGPNALLCSDPQIAGSLKLTNEQQDQIETQIAGREQVLVQLEQHFAVLAVPPPRTTTDDPLDDPMRNQSWIRYWIDRQFDAEIAGILSAEQAGRLAKVLGERSVSADPWKLFADKHAIHNTIEQMTVAIDKPLIHLDPPTKKEVYSAWAEQQRRSHRDVTLTLDDIHIVREKVVDFTTPAQHVETFGEGRLHIVIYVGTVYERGAATPMGSVYIDIARFYPVDMDSSADAAKPPGHQALRQTSSDVNLDGINRELAGLNESLHHDFATDGLPQDRFAVRGDDVSELTAAQPDGFHVTHRGKDGYSNTFVETLMRVHGNFDVTASFESLNVDPGENGSGGISLTAILENANHTHGTIHRGATVDYVNPIWNFVQSEFVHSPQRDPGVVWLGTTAEEATSGRIRLARVGATLYCLFAANDSPEFRLIHAEQVGPEDLLYGGIRLITQVQSNGSTRGTTSVIWKDITIRAERITDWPVADSVEP